MKARLSALLLALTFMSVAKAQSVIAVSIEQHPPLGVAADEVQVELPDGGLALGGGVSVTGGDGSYTYRWTDDGGSLLGTDPTLYVGSAGYYYLAVTDGSGCSVSVRFTAVAPTGINGVKHGGLAVAQDGAWLRLTTGKPIRSVRLVSADGRLAREAAAGGGECKAAISTAGLAQGVYLVGCVFADNSETVKKLTIK